MNFENFKGANTLLQADSRDKAAGIVKDVPVFNGHREQGGGHVRTMIYYAVPTAWERQEIAHGKGIFIELINPPQHPSPISLYTDSPFEPPPVILNLSGEKAREALDKGVKEIVQKIPKEVFDEVFLAMGIASKLGAPEAADDLANAALDLAGIMGTYLDAAYRRGFAEATDAAFSVKLEDLAAEAPDGVVGE